MSNHFMRRQLRILLAYVVQAAVLLSSTSPFAPRRHGTHLYLDRLRGISKFEAYFRAALVMLQ